MNLGGCGELYGQSEDGGIRRSISVISFVRGEERTVKVDPQVTEIALDSIVSACDVFLAFVAYVYV